MIVSALAAKARVAGWGFAGSRPMLGRPAETVRGWLRRFAERAEAVRSVFTVWLRAVDPDPVMPDPAGGGVRRRGDGDRRGRDGDRAPVRAVHGVAGRDRGGGLGWPVVGAGLARAAGATRADPAADGDRAVILCAVVCFDRQQREAAGGGRR